MRVLLGLTVALSLLAPAAGCANRAKTSVALYESGDYAGAARAAEAGLAAHPDDRGLWQMRIRAALALGDSAGVARAYAAYRATLDDDDRELLRDVAEATLRQALASPSAKLKLVAIDAVARAELQSLAEQVAERMEDQDDRVVAAAAVAILRGFPQAPEVADQMLRSEDPEARRIAVDGVGKKVGKLASTDLIKAAATDPDPRVRAAAIRWLGQLRERDALDTLRRNLRHPDDAVRAAAVTALARLNLGDLALVAKQALADKSLAVRLAAIDALVAAKLAPELAILAQSDPEPMVAVEAAIAIRSEDLAARALERAAATDRWNDRAAAANIATRAVGKTAALALARRLVTDAEVGVRLAAARVLAYHGDHAAAAAVFVPALEGDHAIAAATELARLGDERGLTALDRAVRDDRRSPDARAEAAAAHLQANRVTAGLVAALADSSGLVRVEAAAALALMTKRAR